MKYKLIGCVLILTLLIGSSLVMQPLMSTGATPRIDYEAGVATPDPKTIYVDDDNVAGPWNGTRQHPYQNITDGLGHAGTGDTIFVINGTYRENLEIKKMILLIGENKSNTIIDGKGSGTVVKVLENNVTIAKFTIQNSGKVTTIDSGICLYRDDNRINNNIIVNCSCGIKLSGSSGNVIASNVIQSNTHAIYSESSSSKFEKNVIRNNLWGVYFYSSSNNLIYHNRFNNTNQIYIFQSFNNVWNLGYPSGGNYWSDYTGIDRCHGPYPQSKTGSDGIGDTPYNITAQDRDYYPWLLTVHNVDTGLDYIWIQEAIDATNTTDGHTINVSALMHYESVSVYKSLTLLPGGNLTTAIIDGNGTGRGLYINVSNVVVSNFTILNGKYGIQLSGAGGAVLRNITMTNNTYNFFVDGTKLSHFINDIDNSNLVDGKQIYYLINNHDLVINSSAHPDLGYLGLVNCTNMIVQNLNLTGNGQGLLLASTNSSTIEHVNVSNHVIGIYLFDCSGSTITGNDVINNEYYGVYSLYSSSINITGNSMTSLVDGSTGVSLVNSGNSNIVRNSITSDFGIDTSDSGNNNISENHINSYSEGIYLSGSCGTNVTGNNITGTTAYGIELWWSNSSNVVGNTITGTMASCGIELWWSNSSNVVGNTLRNNSYGICLLACFDNTVAINNVAENNFGTWLDDSSDNELDGNDVTNNNDMGIYLRRSSYNNVTNNNITGNPEGVYLLNSDNNNVNDNNIKRNKNAGIYLGNSKNNMIFGNNIVENGCGIFLDVNSPSNSITENSIINNFPGIRLKSSDNTIYHNSFIGKAPQAEVSALYKNYWDNDWRSGGNYWWYYYYDVNDTYHGKTPQILLAGSDGIGDTKYTINSTNNVDNYPLMKPYGGEHDIGIETVICPFCGAPYRAPDPLPGEFANCNYCGATFQIPPRLKGVIRSVYLSKTVFNTTVLKPYNPYILIKVINYGFYAESGITITVQVHNATYNKTIKNETFNLECRNSRIFNYTWPTTGIAKGNYTMTVSITHVTNETYIEDNVYSCNVTVTILGDINGDFKVDIKDLVLVIGAYGTILGKPKWNANADVNNDDKVDIKDLVLVITHWGEYDP